MIHFTSDLHLGHHNIIKYCNRPFSNAQDMDEAIIENINKSVAPKDELYILGDFCLGNHDTIRRYRKRIRCKRIHLVKGNHDKQIPRYLFLTIRDLAKVKVDNQNIILCHYAMRVWEHSHHGSWHLFGHSHGTLKGSGKSFDVGVDTNNFFPYSFEDVKERMQ